MTSAALIAAGLLSLTAPMKVSSRGGHSRSGSHIKTPLFRWGGTESNCYGSFPCMKALTHDLNQSEHSVWMDLDQCEVSTLYRRLIVDVNR